MFNSGANSFFVLPGVQPNIQPNIETGLGDKFNPSDEPALVPGVGTLDYPGENNSNSAKNEALNGTPSYSIGDYLSGRAAANKEDLFNYYRDKDLQEQAERFNAEQAANDRAFNAEQAALQREWEANMSNSAYQRAAADISAMGYNPAVLFSQYANMASTPSGSTASSGAGARSSPGHVSATSASSLAGIIGAAIGAVAGVVGKKMISGSMDYRSDASYLKYHVSKYDQYFKNGNNLVKQTWYR